jgi:hypothetical protein
LDTAKVDVADFLDEGELERFDGCDVVKVYVVV